MRLRKITDISLDEFLKNDDLKDIASFRLIKLLESSISICQHLSAKILKKAPESYSNCFEMLSEANIINVDLSEKLQQMARFRNMLIHVYWNIDYRQVYEIIKNDLGDIELFVKSLDKFI